MSAKAPLFAGFIQRMVQIPPPPGGGEIYQQAERKQKENPFRVKGGEQSFSKFLTVDLLSSDDKVILPQKVV